MDKLDALWIRACKDRDPKKRLRSVYRRFYLRTDDEAFITANITALLTDIAVKYCSPQHPDLIRRLVDGNDPFTELLYTIRMVGRTDLPEDFPVPLMFRNG